MVDDLTAILRLRPVDLDLERGLLGGLGFLPVASVDLSDSDALLLAASALSQGSSKISIWKDFSKASLKQLIGKWITKFRFQVVVLNRELFK